MILSLIAAVSENGVIGNKGKLPWSLPDDLKHFHDLTVGHPVIMGRKTYESIPEQHRPLPDRTNIVITRQDVEIPKCLAVHSLREAIDQATSYRLRAMGNLKLKAQSSKLREVCVIGGAEIYRQALPRADRIYLTRVHAEVEGDAFFPEVDWSAWREVSREEHPADRAHEHPFTFLVYDRLMRGGE